MTGSQIHMNKAQLIISAICALMLLMLTFNTSALSQDAFKIDKASKMKKDTATVKEIGAALFYISQNKSGKNAFEPLSKETSETEKKRIFSELRYLIAFTIDFATYMNIGDELKRSAILDEYYTKAEYPQPKVGVSYQLSVVSCQLLNTDN